MNHKLYQNVKYDYIFCFLRNIDFSSAIWVLYMIYKGVPLYQVGILEAIYHIASFLAEVPTGAMADLFGRKKVMIAGRICGAISSILMLFSHNFVGFALSFILSAWGNNLNSGSEEALVYDSMKYSGHESEYIKVNGRLNIIIEIAQGMSTFLGGFLSEYSYTYCYVLAAVISFISISPILFMHEPEFHTEAYKSEKQPSIRQQIKVCYRILRDDKKIQNILLYYSISFTFYTVMFFYGQKYFSDYGLNKINISFIMLLGGIISCLGSISSGYILRICRDKTPYITCICMGLSIAGLIINNLLIAIILFGISSYINALLYPIQSDSLNKLIPSEQRATIISVNSMLFSFMMIIIFPIAGLVAEQIGLHKTFLILGIFQLVMLFLLLHGKNRKLQKY